MKIIVFTLSIILNAAPGFSQSLKAAIGCDKDSSGFDPHIIRCEMKFTDESAGTPVSWFWNFGDGQFSSDQNPWHTYDYFFLSYHIMLIVQDVSGNSDTAFYTFFNDTSCSCNRLTGMDPLSANMGTYFAPNPIRDKSTLYIQPGVVFQNVVLRFFNAFGKMVSEQYINNIQKIVFDRKNLSAGIYFYEIQSQECQPLARGKVLIN